MKGETKQAERIEIPRELYNQFELYAKVKGLTVAAAIAWALQAGMTVADMLDMPFYHPVVEEGLRTALRDVAMRISRARESPRESVRQTAAARR